MRRFQMQVGTGNPIDDLKRAHINLTKCGAQKRLRVAFDRTVGTFGIPKQGDV